jgi:putative spermidine/putrescine transport system ATP-binding protein
MSHVNFQSITKRFGNVVALDNFTMSVESGELITLLGPSGCGKTTALRIAAGFESPDSGSLIVDGLDILQLPAQKRHMGMVFQNYSLFPHLTVAENVEFGLSVRRHDKLQRLRRVKDMLELVQVGELGARYPHQLSGGQQQRVALARALAIEPSVLLLDEPLSALDAQVRVEVRNEIRSLQKTSGTTTLFVTHDQEEAVAISDRICVMGSGRIHQIDTPENVYRQPATDFVASFIGLSDAIELDGRVVRVRPEDVVLVSPDAPDAYLGYVKRVDFSGSHSYVVVMLNDRGQEVRSIIPNSHLLNFNPGDSVGVKLSHVLFESPVLA